MSRHVIRLVLGVSFLGAAALAGGCGEQGPPVVRMRGCDKDVFLVMRKDEQYHFAKECELHLDEENVLCDADGRFLSKQPITVPGDAEKLWVRGDGMVLAWCDSYWCGIGQLTLLRIGGCEGEGKQPASCKKLWEAGSRCVPGREDCPKIKEIEWVLRVPDEDPMPPKRW